MGRRPSSRALVEDEAAAIAAASAENAAAATAAAAVVAPVAARGGAASTSHSCMQEQEPAQQQQLLAPSGSQAAEEPPARPQWAPGPSAPVSSGSGGSSAANATLAPRPRQRQTVHSYAFMWPVPEPGALGCSGARQAGALLPGGLDPSQLTEAAQAAGVPKWCLGLHSVSANPDAGTGHVSTTRDSTYRVVVYALLFVLLKCLGPQHTADLAPV